MISQIALIRAAAAGAAATAVTAAAVVWTHPGLVLSKGSPAIFAAATGAMGPTTPAAPPVKAPAPPVEAAAAQAAGRPAFDIVSVSPDGETVVAGRAAPNARVALLDGGRTIGEATADARGQFVILPDPLRPGDHSLVLSTGAGGPAERSGAAPVSVAAPPPRVAAAPAPAASPGAAPRKPQVAIRSAEADGSGRLSADGVAAPNATVRLYVGGAFVGDARTAADGRWSLTIEGGMTPGAYPIRADQIGPVDARVLARAEASVTVPALAAASPAAPGTSAAPGSRPSAAAPPSPADVVVNSVQTHTVERGHTLWGISQKFYGDGARYAVIFSANTGQIRDPNLIYPGQTFLVPAREPKP